MDSKNSPLLYSETKKVNCYKKIHKEKSRADIKLKEMEAHLLNAEETCNYIKKRLDHMKFAYENIGAIKCKKLIDSSAKSLNSTLTINDAHRSSIVNETYHDTVRSDENYKKNLEEYSSSIIEVKDSSNSLRSVKVFSDKYFSFRQEKPLIKNEKQSLLIERTSGNSRDKNLFITCNSRKEMSISAESSSSSDNTEDFEDILVPEKNLKPVPPTSQSHEKSLFIPKINGAREEHFIQNEMKKIDKTSEIVCHIRLNAKKKIDSSQSLKVKRKKRKINGVNSKCIEDKTRKTEDKRKEDALAKLDFSYQEKLNEISPDKSDKDIVEIYHNTAMKNISPSAVSSKVLFNLENNNFTNSKVDRKLNEAVEAEVKNINYLTENVVNLKNAEFCHMNLKGESNQADTIYTPHRAKVESHDPQDELHHHNDINYNSTLFESSDCTNFNVKNYQLPTISSLRKQVNRCCLTTKIDMKQIPFFNGTSMSPSHNLGINIQQTVGLMKTKDSRIVSDFQSDLMHEIEKTCNPSMTMLDETNYVNDISQSKQVISEDSCDQTDKVKTENEECQHSISKKLLTNDKKTSENVNHLPNDKNDKIMTPFNTVIHKLYDRFEILNRKYDSLKKQLKKSKDEGIKKEFMKVEKELNEKEELIKVIVDLYSTVISLKRKMKLQHKNSLFYITTNVSQKKSTNIKTTTTRSQTSHTFHTNEYLQTQTSINKNIPSTSTVLVGLLRRIQTVQHQMKRAL